MPRLRPLSWSAAYLIGGGLSSWLAVLLLLPFEWLSLLTHPPRACSGTPCYTSLGEIVAWGTRYGVLAALILSVLASRLAGQRRHPDHLLRYASLRALLWPIGAIVTVVCLLFVPWLLTTTHANDPLSIESGTLVGILLGGMVCGSIIGRIQRDERNRAADTEAGE